MPTISKNITIKDCKKINYNKIFLNVLVDINVAHNLEINECKKAIIEIKRV